MAFPRTGAYTADKSPQRVDGAAPADTLEVRDLRHTVEHVIGPRQSAREWMRDLWVYRQAFAALCARDIRSKYKQAVLGVAWALIQPLAQVLVFTFVFAGVARVRTPVPYPVFALAALLPFNLFQQAVTLGTPAFVAAQGIVTKVYFPRLYTVLAGSTSAFVSAAITLVVLLGAMAIYRTPVTPWAVLAIPMLVGVGLLALGTASALAAVNARFRDVQHALPLALMLLLYLSPVLYPLSAMPAAVRRLAQLNPLSGLVEGFRSALIGIPPSSWTLVWSALATSAVVFAAGVWFFERTQAALIDVL